jgi:hypothetical protein
VLTFDWADVAEQVAGIYRGLAGARITPSA